MANNKTKPTTASKRTTKAKVNSSTKNVATATAVGSLVATKAIKKTDSKTKILALIMLIIGLFVGVLGAYVITRNDCFELLGENEITLEMQVADNDTGLLGTYREDGVKVVSFGKDVSDTLTVEIDSKFIDNHDGTYSATQVGTYYIKYHSNSLKYGKIFTVEKIRLITFVEPSEITEKEEA